MDRVSWYLNKALTNFRNAVNATYPSRDKTSDGTIGDEDHQQTSSDHNPDPEGQPDAGSVDAWDMDVDLKVPDVAAEIEKLKGVFQNHESSQYWIHNRQIASRSDGWRRESYSGSSDHTKHVHWNTRESHENSSAPWVIPPPQLPTPFPGETMIGFVKSTDPAQPQVFVGDGIYRRPVDEQDITDIKYLAGEGWLGPLAHGGAVRSAANLDTFGVLPGEATMSQAQLDLLIDAVVEAAGLAEEDKPIIKAAVREVLKEGVG